MRVYLDNCCYNRPYDDQSNFLIKIETECKMKIQNLIKQGELDLVSSYILMLECDKNPHEPNRSLIIEFIKKYSKLHVSENNYEIIENLAIPIKDTGVKNKDALHVASAIYAECDYFISTDRRLLKYSTEQIKIVSPLKFFETIEGV